MGWLDWNNKSNGSFSSSFENTIGKPEGLSLIGLPGTDPQFMNQFQDNYFSGDASSFNNLDNLNVGVDTRFSTFGDGFGINRGQPGASHSWYQNFMGGTNKDGTSFGGYGKTALGLAAAGLNAWTGYKNMKIAGDTLDFQKDAFSKQFDMQRSDVNRQLEERQKRKVSAAQGRGNVTSVEDYMKKYRV